MQIDAKSIGNLLVISIICEYGVGKKKLKRHKSKKNTFAFFKIDSKLKPILIKTKQYKTL